MNPHDDDCGDPAVVAQAKMQHELRRTLRWDGIEPSQEYAKRMNDALFDFLQAEADSAHEVVEVLEQQLVGRRSDDEQLRGQLDQARRREELIHNRTIELAADLRRLEEGEYDDDDDEEAER